MSRYHSFVVKQRFLSLLLFLPGCLAAHLIGTGSGNFYPSERVEIENPAGKENRAFTEVVGFVDTSINVYASDWPHTFLSPVRLGDIYFDEYPNEYVRWSKDGTVIGVTVVKKQGEPEYFQAAYDFQNHEVIPDKPYLSNLHNRINALMESRGGVGEPPQGIDDGKMPSRLSTPPWFRVTSLGILSLSLFASVKIWKRKDTARPIIPEAALQ